jgi:hypothetical protein
MGKKMRYLTQHSKSKNFLFKRDIPAHLRPILGFKKTAWIENLHTKIESEARLKCIEVTGRVEAIFQQAEAKLAGLPPSKLDVSTVRKIVSRWRDSELLRYAEELLNHDPKDDILSKPFADEYYETLRTICWDDEEVGLVEATDEEWEQAPLMAQTLAETKTLQIFSQEGVLLTCDHKPFPMASILVKLEWRELLLQVGRWISHEDLLTLPTVPVDKTPIVFAEPPKAGKKLSEVFDAYKTEMKIAPSALREYHTAIRRLMEIVGGDKPMREIRREDVILLKESLTQVPVSTSKEDRTLPLSDLVKKYEGKKVARIGVATYGKQLRLLSALFKWGKKHNHCDINPCENLIPASATAKKQAVKRLSFTVDDIRKLFTSPLFAGCLHGSRINVPGSF